MIGTTRLPFLDYALIFKATRADLFFENACFDTSRMDYLASEQYQDLKRNEKGAEAFTKLYIMTFLVQWLKFAFSGLCAEEIDPVEQSVTKVHL